MPEITELVIDRAKWGIGSCHNSNGTKCCLGHLATACGVPDSEMPNNGKLSYPKTEWINKYGINSWAAAPPRSVQLIAMPPRQSPLAVRAANINDSNHLTLNEKEEKLIKLFSEQSPPIALSFIGQKS